MLRTPPSSRMATLLIAILLGGLGPAWVEADPGAVPKGVTDKHAKGQGWWVYNDIDRARLRALETGKPIFVTFRCVPCEECAGFDYQVAKGSERIRKLAAERFISVRQVEMKGVNLDLFQFDYDLNWAAMFINADGTVYGRYGTQSAEGADAYNSIGSLARAMRRVLKLHENYPANREALAGKRGPEKPYDTPLEMPGMDRKAERRGPTTRKNCIHCHNIHDAEQRQWIANGTFSREKLWRYPLPENVGLSIARDHGRRIEEVTRGSAAHRAGLKAGDVLTHMNGQPIVSIADIQWVLHHTPNEAGAEVELTVRRDGGTLHRTLELNEGWRKTDISWRGSMWSLRPRLAVWAVEVSAEKRRALGLSDGRHALRVKWINKGVEAGRAAHRGGLRQGDLIVGLEGEPLRKGQREFQLHVRLNYEAGDRLPLTVLRDGERHALKIPLVKD